MFSLCSNAGILDFILFYNVSEINVLNFYIGDGVDNFMSIIQNLRFKRFKATLKDSCTFAACVLNITIVNKRLLITLPFKIMQTSGSTRFEFVPKMQGSTSNIHLKLSNISFHGIVWPHLSYLLTISCTAVMIILVMMLLST